MSRKKKKTTRQNYAELLAENKRLKEDNYNLQRMLERSEMWERAYAGGVRSTMNQEIDRLQRERDEAIERWQKVSSYMGAEIGYKLIDEDISPDTTLMSVLLLLRPTEETTIYAVRTKPALMPWPLEETQKRVIPQMWGLLAGVTKDDIASVGNIGISDMKIRNLISILIRYRDDDDLYNQKRKQMIDDLWDELNVPDYEHPKAEFNDRINKVINRTMKKIDKRIKFEQLNDGELTNLLEATHVENP